MEEISEEKKNKIQKEIKQFLISIGIKPHIKGFRYWTTAILYAVEQELLEKDLGKFMELYRYVGKKHKATVSKVEKDMRYVFENVDYKRVFNVDYRITNSAFLFLAREKILKLI